MKGSLEGEGKTVDIISEYLPNPNSYKKFSIQGRSNLKGLVPEDYIPISFL